MEKEEKNIKTDNEDKSQKILIIVLAIILLLLIVYAFIQRNNDKDNNNKNNNKEKIEEVTKKEEEETNKVEEQTLNTNTTTQTSTTTVVDVNTASRLDDAKKAVEKANYTKTILLVNTAQELINKLDEGTEKNELQSKINTIKEKINNTIEEFKEKIILGKELLEQLPNNDTFNELKEELETLITSNEEILEDTSNVTVDVIENLKQILNTKIGELAKKLKEETAINLINEIQEIITNASNITDITNARGKLIELNESINKLEDSSTKTLLLNNYTNLSTRLSDITAPNITFVNVIDNKITLERGTVLTLPQIITDEETSLPVTVVPTSCDVDTSVIGEYTCTYTATDANYNSSTANLKILVVDTTEPTVTITYETSLNNTKYVKTDLVKITSLEKINIIGWTKVDDYNYTKEYTSNVTDEQVIISDLVGNNTIETITTTMIDNIAPTVTGVLDNSHNKTVTPIIADDMKLESYTLTRGIEEITGYVAGTEITTEGNYTLTLTDEAGNTTSINFVIDNTKPVIDLDNNTDTITIYDNYTGSVDLIVSFTKNEVPITFYNGMTISENGSYKLIVTDKAGNSDNVQIDIGS